jgi:hypothetical protein
LNYMNNIDHSKAGLKRVSFLQRDSEIAASGHHERFI